MFEIPPPARHTGNATRDEDDGQDREDDDVEHDSVHHTLERSPHPGAPTRTEDANWELKTSGPHAASPRGYIRTWAVHLWCPMGTARLADCRRRLRLLQRTTPGSVHSRNSAERKHLRSPYRSR